MVYTDGYASPLGEMTIAGDGGAIIGLWFDGQKHFGNSLPEEFSRGETPVIRDAKRWLDIYFSGRTPDFLPPLRYGSTPFRKLVCDIMLSIPYGKTRTYGDIAKEAAALMGVERMAAQAVGGAVGNNPILLMIPCHRVIGANGNLTGYGGGMQRKIKLLEMEGVNSEELGVRIEELMCR